MSEEQQKKVCVACEKAKAEAEKPHEEEYECIPIE
jgi:hypothetical protein